MLRYWEIPEPDLNPPADPDVFCDDCGCRIDPGYEYGEIRGLFPRHVCRLCTDYLTDEERELLEWDEA